MVRFRDNIIMKMSNYITFPTKYIHVIYYITIFQTVYTQTAFNRVRDTENLFLGCVIFYTILFDWNHLKAIIVYIHQFRSVYNHRELSILFILDSTCVPTLHYVQQQFYGATIIQNIYSGVFLWFHNFINIYLHVCKPVNDRDTLYKGKFYKVNYVLLLSWRCLAWNQNEKI